MNITVNEVNEEILEHVARFSRFSYVSWKYNNRWRHKTNRNQKQKRNNDIYIYE